MKQRYLILLMSFIAVTTAAFGATRPWDNGRLEVSDNGRFLRHADGTPFFWLADTGWLLPERLNRDEAEHYLSRCAEAGYNVVQVQVVNGVPAFNAYGQMSMTPDFEFVGQVRGGRSVMGGVRSVEGGGRNASSAGDISPSSLHTPPSSHHTPPSPNLSYGYWDHMDYIVDCAARHGIYVGMVCIWGGLVKAGHMDEAKAVRYGRFLAERYGRKKNIVWIIGGDIEGSVRTAVWDTLATTIKSIDPNHLMTFHPRGRTTSAKWFNDRPWLDFNMFQSGHRRYGQRMGNKHYPIPDGTEEDSWMYVDSAWQHRPLKPVLDGEPSYEGIPQGLHDGNEPRWTARDVRRYAYWSVFAGSCGHTYGNNSIMQFVRPGVTGAYFADGDSHPWYRALDDPGYNQMKYLRHLMLSLPYFDRIPDQTAVRNNGVRYDRLLATRGQDYLLVYNHTGRDMTVDLTKISGGEKDVWWMDPTDGRLTYLGRHPSRVTTFRYHASPSGVPDGVLIAIDTSKNYIGRTQTSITSAPAADGERDLTE